MDSQYNINIAVLGTVSAGKSTLLNSLFLEELATMNICRNTMIPQIYKEITNNKTKNVKQAKQINLEISEINEKIKLNSITYDNYDIAMDFREIEFYIHKLKEFNLCGKDVLLHFYDIPGLNDNKFHQTYYKYVQDNFDNFDIVLYLINIESGLNSKDEIDLLDFICGNVGKTNPQYVIPIINKSDDMTMNSGKLECKDIYKNNWENILCELNTYISRYNLHDWVAKPILYSAQEAFMYRTLHKNPNYELSEQTKNIIGFNDMGKKYYTLSNEDRLVTIGKIINDAKFIETMIKMSGYNDLFCSLKNILTMENQLKLCVGKLIRNFDKITKLDIGLENIIQIYEQVEKIHEKISALGLIFDCVHTYIDVEIFVKKCLETVLTNVDPTNCFDIINLKNILEQIKSHNYKKYLVEELVSADILVTNMLYQYYCTYYPRKNSLEDLYDIIVQLNSNQIYKNDEYSLLYFEKIQVDKIDFYSQLDFADYNSLKNFDSKYKTDLSNLKSLVDNTILKNIYKYLIKNKISNLIENINSNSNNICILYNLMLFYNYYSTKNIEFSEIYMSLLCNYMNLVKTHNMELSGLEKVDTLVILDNDYVNF
jgi:predicted GTPase